MKKILKLVENALKEKQGEDIEIIDVSKTSPLADYLILVSSSNVRKLNALKEEVERVLVANDVAIKKISGKTNTGWIIIDAYDLIIHLFSTQERERIDLDTLLLEDFGGKRTRRTTKKVLN